MGTKTNENYTRTLTNAYLNLSRIKYLRESYANFKRTEIVRVLKTNGYRTGTKNERKSYA